MTKFIDKPFDKFGHIVVENVDDDVKKSKYTKRTGASGSYKYYYDGAVKEKTNTKKKKLTN